MTPTHELSVTENLSCQPILSVAGQNKRLMGFDTYVHCVITQARDSAVTETPFHAAFIVLKNEVLQRKRLRTIQTLNEQRDTKYEESVLLFLP